MTRTRFLLATLLCLGGGLSLQATAAHAYFSGSYFWTVGGQQSGPVIHIHSPNGYLTVKNQASMLYNLFVLTDQARYEWEQRTVTTLPSTVGAANITVNSGAYGNTGWSGISSVADGLDRTFGHYGQNSISLNHTYLSGWSDRQRRGIACQEIGHALGVGHGGTGCMGFTYYVGGDNNTIRSPTDFDVYHVNYLYGFGNHG